MWRTQALLVALLLLGAPARGQEQRPARRAVKEHRAGRRVASTLRSENVPVSKLVELTERDTFLLAESVRAVAWELWALQKKLPRKRELRAMSEELAAARMKELRTRLAKVHRRLRRGQDPLLPARRFALLMERARTRGTRSGLDRAALESVEQARTTRSHTLAGLARLGQSIAGQMEELDASRHTGKGSRRALAKLRAEVSRHRDEARQLIRELERVRRELRSYQVELKSHPETSGFGILYGQLPRPAQGHIEVGFGEVLNPRFDTITLRKGVDIRAEPGSPVRAVAPGEVVHVGWLRGYGNLLILDHGGGYHTLMAHLERIDCEVGQQVEAGEQVATVGDTGSLWGPSLYFEIRRHGRAVDPADWLLPR